MGVSDNAGRIPKRAFLVSILLCSVIALISASARFYIRIRVQKQLSIDDGFLLLSICSMVTAIAIMSTFVDNLYMFEAIIFPVPGFEVPSDLIERRFVFQKMSGVGLMLTLLTIVSIKLSFLFLFKTLIARLRYLIMYWWIVMVLTLAVAGYCFAVHIMVCPHCYDMKALQFTAGHPTYRTFYLWTSANVLDIFTDLLILFIPIRLIWQIRIQWTQKMALTFSLCLTIMIIIIAAIRSAGLLVNNEIDIVWGIYWQYMAAEVAIIMAALTAFRQFFVARSNDKRQHSPALLSQWSPKFKRLFRRILTASTWQTKKMRETTNEDQTYNLPPIPRGTMTGIRTFIDRHGRTKIGASRIQESSYIDPREETPWDSPSNV